jgi:dihydrofolate synthase/folylpolyglutamate synthase
MDYQHGKRYLETLPDWEKGRPASGPLEQYLPRVRALLERLGHPERSYRSLIVGGTNGKGTVSSLLAALLRAAGHRVGLYTSPHLHSLRERIQIDGEVLHRDQWADGIGLLYDRTRDFEAAGLGSYSRFEALTALAAHLFAQEEVQYAVFEVGLGGRYDATNAWDSELAVLTSIGLDHVELLGHTVAEIAGDKVHIGRPGRPLFTTAAQPAAAMARIRRACADRGIALFVAGVDEIDGPDGPRPYAWSPSALPGRPATFHENARLAVAAAGHLLGDRLPAPLAQQIVCGHSWPGRFEAARGRPLVLLDGAHNPGAAAALARDLAGLAPRWTLVIGVNHGHDAGGILRALGPVAQRVILTTSDHPKAIDVQTLAALVPDGLPVRLETAGASAFARAVAEAGEAGHVCVAGSLYLVAQAREHFHLPSNRDGVSEEAALESLECLQLACQREGVAWQRISDNGQVVRLYCDGRPLHFLRNKHPFNDYVAARLAEDKAYQYELLGRAGLPVPRTLQVFNPFADDRFNRYKTHASIEAIAADAERRFAYPVVVKKYHSSLAQGVYLEPDRPSLERRLRVVCENSGFLDNILLIQEYVCGPEYRIVASQEEMLLAYEKQSDRRDPGGDLNPLHQSGGRAVPVAEPQLLANLRELTALIAREVDLGFYAVDLIGASDGLRILELNPNPFCFFYNRDNGREDFVRIYQRLLAKYVTGPRTRSGSEA